MELQDEAIMPLFIGADGVNVPFRPEGGKDRTVCCKKSREMIWIKIS